ncbi:MAG: hypothetical protein AB7K68_09770 [Bacteriovoracia bacterium]
MKFFLFALFLANSAQAATYELATIAGTPNANLPFVAKILKKFVGMVPGANETDYTTGLFYFAERNGTETAQAIQILNERGNATKVDFAVSLDVAKNSAIVLATVGGGSPAAACERAASNPHTAYLFSAAMLNPNDPRDMNGPCRAKNILFVTSLNANLTDVGEYSPVGSLVRLAVPAMRLSAPVDEKRSVTYQSVGFGMAMAAGKMAKTLREYPFLEGSALVERFLRTKTARLGSLKGKVAGERALLQFNQ